MWQVSYFSGNGVLVSERYRDLEAALRAFLGARSTYPNVRVRLEFVRER